MNTREQHKDHKPCYLSRGIRSFLNGLNYFISRLPDTSFVIMRKVFSEIPICTISSNIFAFFFHHPFYNRFMFGNCASIRYRNTFLACIRCEKGCFGGNMLPFRLKEATSPVEFPAHVGNVSCYISFS